MTKRIKRLLKRRSKAGFTLVEVVVSCALLSVLVLGVLGFMTPVLKSVAEKQENARATMLAEAVDSYVVSSIRNCEYMKIFSGVTPGSLSTLMLDSDVVQMQNRMESEDVLKCVAFRWMPVGMYDEYKLVLVSIDLESGSYEETPIFGDSFYDGLSVIPQVSLMDNQYTDGDPVSPTNMVPDERVHNIGINLITKVYTDLDCYSTSSNSRQSSHLAFVGQSYDACTIISSAFSNHYNSGYTYEIYDINDTPYDGTSIPSASIYTDELGKTYYYPETYFIYVERSYSY